LSIDGLESGNNCSSVTTEWDLENWIRREGYNCNSNISGTNSWEGVDDTDGEIDSSFPIEVIDGIGVIQNEN